MKTWVMWDINSCPVPDGYDASLVGQCIESWLKKADYNSGPLTITAIGSLNHTMNRTPHVLPAIYSTGILLKHVPNCDLFGILWDLESWARNNPPPATIVLISGSNAFLRSTLNTFTELTSRGYNTFLVYPQRLCGGVIPIIRGCVWETLLKGEYSRETRRQCETGGSAWLCSICSSRHTSFQGKSFEDFITHLKSRGHALRELDCVTRPISSKLHKDINYDPDKEEEDKWDRITV